VRALHHLILLLVSKQVGPHSPGWENQHQGIMTLPGWKAMGSV